MPKSAQHSISTAITLEGASDYKRDLDAIRAGLKQLDAEYKLLNAQYADNEKSLEALTAKQANYTARVALLNRELDTLRQISGDWARKAQENVARQEELTRKTQVFADAIKTEKQWLEESKQKTAELSAKKAELEEKLKRQIEKYGEHNKALNFTKGEINKVTQAIEEEKVHTEKYQVALDNLTHAYEADKSELAALPELYKKIETEQHKNGEQIAKVETQLLNYNKALQQTTDELNRVQNGEKVLTEEERKAAEEAEKAAAAQQKEAEALEAVALEFVNRRIVEDFHKLVDVLKQCVSASIEFESSLTSVQKTSDFTKSELAQFASQVKQLAVTIPITTEELNRIAETAGQLGIAKSDIINFTEVMAKMGVATNMTAEAAANSLAQIASVTGMTADEYENLASTIVALGNNYATTESNITTFMQRIAGSASNVGITEAQMAGLATAVSSVGMQADAGGTAIQSLINKMQSAIETGDGLESWAKVMGISTEELADLWKNNASEALLKFVQGLGKLDGTMVSTLKDLGIGEQRLIRTVTNIANAEEKTQLLSRALETANTAWAENNALAIEASKRFETTESQAILMENAINNLKIAVGDNLKPAVENMMGLGKSAAETVTWMVENVPFLTDVLTGLTAALGVMGAKASVTTGAIHEWIEKMSNVNWTKVFDPVTMGIAAVVALGTAMFALASRTENAGTETKKLVKNLSDARKEAEKDLDVAKEQAEVNIASVETLNELMQKEEKDATDKAVILKLVEQLNDAMPTLNMEYDIMGDKLIDASTGAEKTADSIDEIARSLAKQRVEEEKVEALTQLYVNRAKIEDELAKRKIELAAAQKKWTDELTNGSEAAAYTEAEVNALTVAVNELEKELIATNEAIDGNGGDSGFVGATEKATEATSDMHSKVDSMVTKLHTLQKEYETTAAAAKIKLAGEVAGAFDEVAAASTMEYETVMANLQSQIDFYTNYSNNINDLNSRNIDGMQDMLKQMQDEGKLTAEVAATMAKMTDEQLANVVNSWKGVQTAQTNASNSIAEVATQYTRKSKEIKDALNSIKGTYTANVVVNYSTSGSSQAASAIAKGTAGISMKYAQGLEYVPYDDYAALLHEGEMVLTKAEARAYRETHTRGESIVNNNNRHYGGVTLNVYAQPNQDIDTLADEIMYRIDDATKRKEAVWA